MPLRIRDFFAAIYDECMIDEFERWGGRAAELLYGSLTTADGSHIGDESTAHLSIAARRSEWRFVKCGVRIFSKKCVEVCCLFS